MHLVTALKAEAHQLGFAHCGIAPATEQDLTHFDEWLARGHAGDMHYLHKHRDARQHPNSILEGCRNVVMLAAEHDSSECNPPRHHGRVARYARGPDYHNVLRKRLNALGDWLQVQCPGERSRGVVDTAPLLERDFARRAGLGWIGKNTMLIHPRHGSFLMLAALLTTAVLPADTPFDGEHCGTCTACLSACPTHAFTVPGRLDATRCISYLTIEHRGAIPLHLRDGLGDWLHGCDVCQEVCPWNRFAGAAVRLPHDPSLASLDCIELLSLDDATFRHRFRGTPLFRDKRSGLLRNACIVLGNSRDAAAIPALERATSDADPLIAAAAAWALTCIHGDGPHPMPD